MESKPSDNSNIWTIILAKPELPVAIVGLIGTLAALLIPKIVTDSKVEKLRKEGVQISSSSQLYKAEEQNRAWDRNMDCFTEKSRTLKWLDSPGIRVAPIVCPFTGDILVQIKYLQNDSVRPIARWITADEMQVKATNNEIGLSLLGLKAASASTLPNLYNSTDSRQTVLLASDSFTIISQARTSPTTLTRLTRSSSGKCFREVISTYTGGISKQPLGECPLVYIQFPSEATRNLGERLRSAVNSSGFASPAIENVGDNSGPKPKIPKVNQIRIAPKHKQYISRLQQAMKAVGLASGSILSLNNEVTAIEIWIGSANSMP